MSCHCEEGALVHAPEDQLADCIVCGLEGCTDPDCDCGNKPAAVYMDEVIHPGACLAVFREGEIEIAALGACLDCNGHGTHSDGWTICNACGGAK